MNSSVPARRTSGGGRAQRGGVTSLPEPPGEVPEAFLHLGSRLSAEETIDGLLEPILRLAAATVPSAKSVSISVRQEGGAHTSISDGPVAAALDQVQYDEGEGPCLEAVRGHQIEADVAHGGCWPAFGAKAAELGVRNVLSTPLSVKEGTLGAINVYTTADHGFNDAERRDARLLAEHAALVLAIAFALRNSLAINEQLREALMSREVVGEAKGILMQQQRCTRQEAFDILRRASQRQNHKLRELAEALVLAVEARARDRGRAR